MKKGCFLISVMLSLGLCGLYAQDKNTLKQPDLQTSGTDFFDPTRKDKEAEQYHFRVDYRIEAGYVQNNQRSNNDSYPYLFLHGGRIGATFDFQLPLHFSIQTGLFYTLTYGTQSQKWGPMSEEDQYAHGYTIDHRYLEHNLTIPIRAFYTINLWKKLNLFFYTGPQMQIGLAQRDNLTADVTDYVKSWMDGMNVPLLNSYTTIATQQRFEPYDRYQEKELYRFNIQYGVGGGFDWNRYRIQAGYDFGLNNLVRTKVAEGQHMWEWSWYISLSYKF